MFIRRRLDTVRVVEVKGHAADDFFNNKGNDLADTVADFGQLRQLGSVISARRPSVRARCRRYPIYMGHLHLFFISISYTVVNLDGGSTTAPDLVFV